MKQTHFTDDENRNLLKKISDMSKVAQIYKRDELNAWNPYTFLCGISFMAPSVSGRDNVASKCSVP